jgi:hypothetical protein
VNLFLLISCAYLWPAPWDEWDIIVEEPNPEQQQQLIDAAAKGEPGHWVFDT